MVERRLISLPSQLQLLERLQHLIYLSSSLLILSGEKGSGKSTLAEQLSNALPKEQQQVFISISPATTVEKIRQQIITQLYNNPLFNPEDRLIDTFSRLQKEQPESRHRLLIIDNAQHLPTALFLELCELLSLLGESEFNFNLLLLTDEKANADFLEQVEQELPASLAKELELVELSVDLLPYKEAEALLQHCFHEAGYQAQVQHQDALQQQIRSCIGNPKKIIELAARLSTGKINSVKQSWLKSTLPSILLMLLCTAIVVVFGNYLYTVFIDNSPVKQHVENIKQGSEESPNPINTGPELSSGQETLAASWPPEMTQNQSAAMQSVANDSSTNLDVIPRHSEPLMEPEYSDNIDISETELPLLSIENERLDEQPLVDFSESASASLNTDIQQPESVSDTLNTAINQPEPVQEKQLALPAASQQQSLLTETAQLLIKPAKHYTLQLSGMSSQQSLSRFARKHQLPQDNVFVYQTFRNNKPWYVVIYGEYDTIRSAQLAAKNLPASFTNINAWVKSWKTVHNDLRLTNE